LSRNALYQKTLGDARSRRDISARGRGGLPGPRRRRYSNRAMKHATVVCCLLLGLLGCARTEGAVVDVRCDAALELKSRLLLRLPLLHETATSVEPDGLWRELPQPADRVAVIGFAAEPGAWRFSPAALAGDWNEPLAPPARRRLDRFLTHARETESSRGADDPARGRALALHATRALATELIGKYKLPVVFARFDAAGLGEDVYVADAIRDIADLARPAPTLIWLRDGRQRVVLTVGAEDEEVTRWSRREGREGAKD